MERRKQTLKSGVVGLNAAEQRQVRGGVGYSSRQSYRDMLYYGRWFGRRSMGWSVPYPVGYGSNV